MKLQIPQDIGTRLHFYGCIETPNDIVKFFCNYYTVNNSVITIYDFLIDQSATNKAPFLQKNVVFYEKVEIIGYMAAFTPYTTPLQEKMKGGENTCN